MLSVTWLHVVLQVVRRTGQCQGPAGLDPQICKSPCGKALRVLHRFQPTSGSCWWTVEQGGTSRAAWQSPCILYTKQGWSEQHMRRVVLLYLQVPDFTIPLSNEYEAQYFMDATAADLPKTPKSPLQERNAPIGKVFLFTNQDHAPHIYKALAMQFVGTSRLLFAWTKVSTTEGPSYPLMQRMNVSGGCCWMPAVQLACCLADMAATACEAAEHGADMRCLLHM